MTKIHDHHRTYRKKNAHEKKHDKTAYTPIHNIYTQHKTYTKHKTKQKQNKTMITAVSNEAIHHMKRVVKVKKGNKVNGEVRPFCIEWEKYPDEKDYTWEPLKNLPACVKEKYCMSGKPRTQYKKRKAKEKAKDNVALKKPKKMLHPPVPHKEENHAVIPAKKAIGTKEYGEYEDPMTGERILVVKTYVEGRVEYRHFYCVQPEETKRWVEDQQKNRGKAQERKRKAEEKKLEEEIKRKQEELARIRGDMHSTTESRIV